MSQTDSTDLKFGQQVVFKSALYDWEYSGTVTIINQISEQYLEFSQLSSEFGGPIAVTSQGKGLKIVDSYYKVQISVDQSGPHSAVFNGIRSAYLELVPE